MQRYAPTDHEWALREPLLARGPRQDDHSDDFASKPLHRVLLAQRQPLVAAIACEWLILLVLT
jgi:hypothetical protein